MRVALLTILLVVFGFSRISVMSGFSRISVVSGFSRISVVSGFSRISHAQTSTDRDAVLKVVQAFFDTMTAKDVDGARDILVPQGRFHAMRAGAEPRSLSNEEYLAQLQASKQSMRERIWNPEVRVHGPIATMWAPYDFWIDGKFSHCGIDAFNLIKTDKGWKIAGGTYTIESKCEASPLGPLK